MTKDAKNEQAKAPLPMESFFTRENANEGIELPLLLPDGTKTEHWLRIRGVDADGFRKAEARSKRKMLEIAAEKDLDKRDAEVEDTRLAMLAALVIGWSFDNPCTEAEIKRLFREAPQIAEQVDRTAYAGTGNPFFTTDTGSSLRGIEIEADVMLKGTRVDGIYTADPEKDPTATKFDDITYDEVLKRGLKVMDLTATCMCKENNLPIVVFDMDTAGNLKKVISGEEIGTVVHN